MINNDRDAIKIIKNRVEKLDYETIEYSILFTILSLMENYSFIDNQTYPRPSHPNINKRKDSYFTLIAIILSLRTTLENEQNAVKQFMERYNGIDDVLNSNVDEIAQIIKCAGMPVKKANTIFELSKIIKEQYFGNIKNIIEKDIESTRKKLLLLPGVGEKSADCMLELAFDLPSIVIDINMFRVVSRLYFDDQNMSFNNNKDILRIKNFLENNLISDYQIYQIVHTIFLLHGKYICKSKPLCTKCKLSHNCKYCSINKYLLFKK